MATKRPSKGFLTRDRQRHLLTFHFALFLGGVGLLASLNRNQTPDRMWFQWVALPWLALLCLHLVRFSRATLASMTGGSGGEGRLPPGA